MLKPSKNLTKAFTEQIQMEFGAMMQYLAIANHFTEEALPELAKFFYRQADEERTHAMKFVHFLLDVGASVEMPSVHAPKSKFKAAEDAVALALAGEEKVTESISNLVDLARKENHHAAQRFLDWFVVEQQEEESSMSALLRVVRRAGETGLLHVEQYLARQGGAPAEEAEADAT
ncbi:MAG: ferritin [Thermoanaerobaculia bacterium]